MKLRVGLVGIGNTWDSRYGPALRALSDRFEVRAVCEEVSLRAEHVSREFGATAVDGFRALTRREDIDAVLILSKQWYGVLPILAAAEAGKAVYSACGLDLKPEQSRAIKEQVERAGIAFMAEFPCRQAPATLRLKELIATRLGAPRLLFCHRREFAEDLPSATPRKKLQSNATNVLIELVDWCRYVVGHDPRSVVGVMHPTHSGADDEDYQMMSLDFPDAGSGFSATAQVSCGRYVPAAWTEAVTFRPPAALQVACEHGIAFIDFPSTLIWFDNAGRHLESLESERPVGEQLLSLFHREVTSLVRSTSSLEDAYRALSIVVEARRSYAEGRRIALEF